jgi:hypothetical protein
VFEANFKSLSGLSIRIYGFKIVVVLILLEDLISEKAPYYDYIIVDSLRSNLFFLRADYKGTALEPL